MKLFQRLIICIITWAGIGSCQDKTSNYSPAENGIYYWRTSFSLNERERNFLKKHYIKKMYVHFFDVQNDWKANNIVPEATIKFNDSVPRGIAVVPTIYITHSAMEAMQLREDEYAEKMLRRVNAMCKKNNISFNELQLDCDWTKSTQKHFYRLCEAMKSRLDSTQCLSSTIRLHQLTQTPPPVDKGVLMVYNTGNLMEMTTDNSIFSYKDIEPYLRDDRLSKYSLPIDVAYPVYGWSLIYNLGGDGEYHFNRIMQRSDFSSYPEIKQIKENVYEATTTINFSQDEDSWDNVYKGGRIRVERPTAKEIMKVKTLIDDKLKGKPHNNILYHLDEQQLSHYSDNEISKIYSRN